MLLTGTIKKKNLRLYIHVICTYYIFKNMYAIINNNGNNKNLIINIVMFILS